MFPDNPLLQISSRPRPSLFIPQIQSTLFVFCFVFLNPFIPLFPFPLLQPIPPLA
jgi:hypothetical protein